MAKLIILSIVIMSFAIPVSQSLDKRPARALKRVRQIMAVFIVIWAFMCLRWYPAIVPLK